MTRHDPDPPRRVQPRPWLWLPLALLALPLGGCPVALVAGGVGGYEVGTDERTVGRQTDDAVITTRIKTQLLADREIRGLNIDVDTLEGRVTLSGKVRNRDEAARAEAIARDVKGVLSVDSRLIYSEP